MTNTQKTVAIVAAALAAIFVSILLAATVLVVRIHDDGTTTTTTTVYVSPDEAMMDGVWFVIALGYRRQTRPRRHDDGQ